MGTYERPAVIQPLAAQALSKIGDKMTQASNQAAATLSAVYKENFAKNEKLREEDLAATKTWGQQLNQINTTEYTSFELNTRDFLTNQGDMKYDLRRQSRLKEGEEGYITQEELNRQDLLFERVPLLVNQCNQAVAINMEKYLGIKGKDNQKGGVDMGRSDNKWLKVMKDFDENDGANISYDYYGGRLYLTYTDEKTGEVTEYDAQKFVRGSLKTKNLINTCGDITSSLSGLVDDNMGKDDKGRGGWYQQGAIKDDTITRTVDGEEKIFSQRYLTYKNDRLFYGGDGVGPDGNEGAIIGGIFGQDWSSIYDDDELMKTLYTQLQIEAKKGGWKAIEFNDNGEATKVLQGDENKIFADDYEIMPWVNSDEQKKKAMSLIPQYIKAYGQEFGVGKQYLLQEGEGKDFKFATWNGRKKY